MAETKVLPGAYNRSTNPNLIQTGKWYGLKTEVTTGANGSAIIKLYIDEGAIGNWKLVLQATDDGTKYGKVLGGGNAGIRTDYMDAQFKSYSINEK